MKTLLQRLYSDYLMPSRLAEYEALLLAAAGAGYTQLSVRDFLDLPPGPGIAAPTMVHRHDIDSDLRTTAKMFALEARHGITSSFYFRLSTLDYGLMREIEAYGSEASYRFEEVADYARRLCIRSANAIRSADAIGDAAIIRAHFPAIRSAFQVNLQTIEAGLGRKLRTVSSHGDVANRRLGVGNNEIMADPAFRARCGIACDTDDPALVRRFDLTISDRPAPVYYHPLAPRAALGQYRSICFLTHPVQWETNWRENTKCNLRRLCEGLAR